MKPIENIKILIVTPSPDFPGQWCYKTFADGDKRHHGGETPGACVIQAYERCLVDEDDDVHVCKDGLTISKVGDFVNPNYRKPLTCKICGKPALPNDTRCGKHQ